MPGTPADIDAVFHAALTGDDPALLVDHVLLAATEGEVPVEPERVVDAPELLHEGADVLLVAYSLMTQRALAAAERLADAGVSAAVLNLRVLAPIAEEVVLGHVASFECVVFVDESHGPGSPSTYLMARVLEELPGRKARLVCSANVPSPFSPEAPRRGCADGRADHRRGEAPRRGVTGARPTQSRARAAALSEGAVAGRGRQLQRRDVRSA